jgi:thiosulfate/3-mercaptopyruvate sulfurtransferase
MAQPIIGDDPRTLVSTDWLAAHLNDPDLRILDASYYLPDMGRDALAEYEAAHIPGARFFDIDEISDARSTLPHMAAPVEKFMSRMRAMGVGDGHQVVVYDGVGVFSAARVWWNFRLMGKTDVAVLNGGFPKWQAEGREVEDLPPMLRDRHMTAQRAGASGEGRDAGRLGLEARRLADPRRAQPRAVQGRGGRDRPGLRSGHIPGSINVHYATLLNDDKTMKQGDALRAVFEAAGADVSKRTITTCGSGVTAAILMLALERLGNKDVSLYDGSWSEWGQFEQLKVETG